MAPRFPVYNLEQSRTISNNLEQSRTISCKVGQERIAHTGENWEEQIVGTREKPQWIVIQGLLSHLQYPDATKSSTKDLSHAHGMLRLAGVIFVDWYQPVKSGQAYNFTCECTYNEKHCLVSMASDLEAFSR